MKPQHRYSIEDMQDLAKIHGGKCLSKKYKGLVRELKWKCSCGHMFISRPASIKFDKKWCPKCHNT